jgi:RNA polymerase sigma-70 factor (TIGR02943 family)
MEQVKSQITKDDITVWVDQYGDELYSWASFKTSSSTTAEDLVQDTFIAAYQAVDKFKGNSNPKTWLFSILKNKIIDHYRKKTKSFLSYESEQEQKGKQFTDSFFDKNEHWSEMPNESLWDDEDHILDDPDFQSTMKKCMDDLPDNWQTAILSKYILEKDSQEICQELEISPSNYWQILHRSKLMLRKCIELNWFTANE